MGSTTSVLLAAVAAAALAAPGCVTTLGRFPADVQASLADTPMRRLETDRLVIYHPAARRDLAVRLADRLERCADALAGAARIDNRHSREKMFVVVPELPFNNAYVLPSIAGLQDTAVIPAVHHLDFTTEFGLPPDPAAVGCHELTHYVQLKQIAGLWGALRTVFGDVASPQLGLDAWFIEGLATYYEARLQPAIGRPRWPVFTGMFAAAHAGGRVGASDLSESKRASPVGNHYLVGAMFVSFLAERYGDAALWRLVELQARSASIILSANGRFAEVYGKDLSALLAEFRAWTAEHFPVRPRPAGETVVRALGNDARWAWADGGAVAVIDRELDRDTTLTIWEPDGAVRARLPLVDLTPPRALAIADPLLVSGMSFTADGRDLYFTAIDLGNTYQTTRLFRVRDDRMTEVAHGLGPGGTISADGKRYFHLAPDGDRWSLGAYELATGGRATLWTADPGQYALTVAASADGRRLAVSGWNGRRYVVWLHDADTGARLGELTGAGEHPIYDPSFAPGGKLVWLDERDGRFQVAFGGADGRRRIVTDTPYTALAPRVVGERLRYLSRAGQRWELVETALPSGRPDAAAAPAIAGTAGGPAASTAPTAATSPAAPAASAAPTAPTDPGFAQRGLRVEAAPAPARPARVLREGDYSLLDGLFELEERAPALLLVDPTYAVGLTLGGRDRLDLVRWSVSGMIDVDTREPSGAASLELGLLAPWSITAAAGDTRWREALTGGGTRDRRYRAAVLDLRRSWRETYGLSLTGAYREGVVGNDTGSLWGPELGVSYAAFDGSPLAGLDRGVAWTLTGGYYPRDPDDDLVRGRTSLDLWTPLPLSRRHVLHLGGRVHALLQDDRAVLEVGGMDPLARLWSRPDFDPAEHAASPLYPGGDPFIEHLRGFEDLPLLGYRAGLVDLDWTYPLIVDRGLTHLAFLPASFLHQLDLEAFGSAAWIDYSGISGHFAAGGAATLRLTLFRVPLSLRYQVSRRLSDDDGTLQLLSLGTL